MCPFGWKRFPIPCKHALTGPDGADATGIGPVLAQLRHVVACLLGYLPFVRGSTEDPHKGPVMHDGLEPYVS